MTEMTKETRARLGRLANVADSFHGGGDYLTSDELVALLAMADKVEELTAELATARRDLEGAQICRDRESAELRAANEAIDRLNVTLNRSGDLSQRLSEQRDKLMAKLAAMTADRDESDRLLEAQVAQRMELGRRLSDKTEEWVEAVELAAKLCPKYSLSVADALDQGNCEGCGGSIQCGTFAKTPRREA